MMQVCLGVLEGTEVVSGLVNAMKIRPDIVGVACEALHNLFSTGDVSAAAFVDQGLRANVIPFLLSLLEAKLDAKVQKPASTKAQIVTCLKTMAASPQHGEEACTIISFVLVDMAGV